MKNRSLLKGYLFVILSAIIYGLMPLMTKFIYREGVNSVTLVLLKNFLSIPILSVLVFKTKSTMKIDLKIFYQIAFIALMGSCMTPLLLFISYNHIPSGTATVIHYIYPALVVVGEFLFLRSKLNGGHILSVVICILGISLFYNPNDGINLTGSLYALASGLTYAMYVIVLSALKTKKIPVFSLSIYIASICSFFMFFICILSNQLSLPTTVMGWLLAILFAFSLNVAAIILFQRGTFIVGGSRAAILSTLDPITSVVAGIIIFHESANIFTFTGTVLVISASILIVLCDIKDTKF